MRTPSMSQPGIIKSASPAPWRKKTSSKVVNSLKSQVCEPLDRKPSPWTPKGWPVRDVLVRQHVPLSALPSQCSEDNAVRCISENLKPENRRGNSIPSKMISETVHSLIKMRRSHCVTTYRENGKLSRLSCWPVWLNEASNALWTTCQLPIWKNLCAHLIALIIIEQWAIPEWVDLESLQASKASAIDTSDKLSGSNLRSVQSCKNCWTALRYLTRVDAAYVSNNRFTCCWAFTLAKTWFKKAESGTKAGTTALHSDWTIGELLAERVLTKESRPCLLGGDGIKNCWFDGSTTLFLGTSCMGAGWLTAVSESTTCFCRLNGTPPYQTGAAKPGPDGQDTWTWES